MGAKTGVQGRVWFGHFRSRGRAARCISCGMVDSHFVSSLLAGGVAALVVGGLLALLFWHWTTIMQGKITEIEKKLIQRLPPGRKVSVVDTDESFHVQMDAFMPWWSGPARVPSSIKPAVKPRPPVVPTNPTDRATSRTAPRAASAIW